MPTNQGTAGRDLCAILRAAEATLWRKHANSRQFCLGCGRLQPSCRRGRGSHLGAAAGAAQRPDRSDHRRASRAEWSSAPATAALVEFRSVVDAVLCAIEVQNMMVERNAGVPEDRRIVFRIGNHLGDVVEESDGD